MSFLFAAASFSSEGEIALLFWATIGGICVFAGLSIEKIADWMNGRFLAGSYEPHKTLENAGWCILMLGIFIEIVIAGSSANEAWQTRQIAIKNDPHNQQAQSAKAMVLFWTEGTNDFINFRNNFNAFSGVSSKLAFGDPDLIKKGAPTMFSSILTMSSHPIWTDGTNIGWRIFFNRDEDVFSAMPVLNVGETTNWNKFEIGIPFLAPGTKILNGEITLTINEKERRIPIGGQIMRGTNDLHSFWDNLTNGIAVFNETNSLILQR